MQVAVGLLSVVGAYYLYKTYSGNVYHLFVSTLNPKYSGDKKKAHKNFKPSSCQQNPGPPSDNLTNPMNIMSQAVQVMGKSMNGDVSAAAQFNQTFAGDTLFASRRV